jgi:Flp pilus assembly protein TadD
LSDYRAVEPLDVLGIAYARAGRYSEAIRAAETALRLARTNGKHVLAAQIERRIELYRQRKPYGPADRASD